MTGAGSQFHDACVRKAFEIGYALVRLANHTRSASFGSHLERYAFDVLSLATQAKYRELQNALAAAEYFLRLGREGALILASHADLLYEEIGKFYDALEGHPYAQEAHSGVSLEGVFTPFAHDLSGNPAIPANEDTRRGESQEISIVSDRMTARTSASAESRQNLIVDKIRQSGICRLKDIQELLPESSERTIRYDIQELITQGRLERVGGGGPATAYRLKEEVPAGGA